MSELSSWDMGSAKRCCISAGFLAALLGPWLPPQRGMGVGSHLLCPVLLLLSLPWRYSLGKIWRLQSLSFRALSHFLLQKMVLLIASNNNMLMAFRSMSEKISFPQKLSHAVCAERRGLVPCCTPGLGEHGELKRADGVLSVSYNRRIFTLHSFWSAL